MVKFDYLNVKVLMRLLILENFCTLDDNSRTEIRIKLLFVAIEPEGKDGHYNDLFQSSNCLL